jgi:hypothetical protein
MALNIYHATEMDTTETLLAVATANLILILMVFALSHCGRQPTFPVSSGKDARLSAPGWPKSVGQKGPLLVKPVELPVGVKGDLLPVPKQIQILSGRRFAV